MRLTISMIANMHVSVCGNKKYELNNAPWGGLFYKIQQINSNLWKSKCFCQVVILWHLKINISSEQIKTTFYLNISSKWFSYQHWAKWKSIISKHIMKYQRLCHHILRFILQKFLLAGYNDRRCLAVICLMQPSNYIP